jgi:hypothetical protein
MANEKDDYEVGYGRPPKHSRFKKGASGNPGGPKPNIKETKAELVAKVALETVELKIGGKVIKVSSIEAAIRRVFIATMQRGSPRDLALLIKMLEEHGTIPYEQRVAEGRASAEAVVKKIFSYLDRTHPGSPENHQPDIVKEEVAIIKRNSACFEALCILWATKDAHTGHRPPTSLQSQMEEADVEEV